jgi:hypothetical protein
MRQEILQQRKTLEAQASANQVDYQSARLHILQPGLTARWFNQV